MSDQRQQLNEMQQFMKISEGAWQLPRTKEDFDKLAAILNSGKNNIEIQHDIYNVLGDDDLFDRLEKLEPQGFDAAETIEIWMKDQRTDKWSNFPNIWNTYKLSQRHDSPMNEEGGELFTPIKYRYVYKDGMGNNLYIGVVYNDTMATPKVKIWNDNRMQVHPSSIVRVKGGNQEIADLLNNVILEVIMDENFEPRSDVTSEEVLSAIKRITYTKNIQDVTGKMDSMTLDEVGEVKHDDYGATPVYENDDECTRCFGLGRHPAGGEDCPECKGTGKCPHIDEDGRPGFQYKHDPEALFHRGDDVRVVSPGDDYDGKAGVVLRVGNGAQTVEFADRQVVSFNDDELEAITDYNFYEGVSLGDIVENVLQEYPGQPKDYDEYEEADQREMADDMDDFDKEFEDDYKEFIDPEYDDSELGLRFD